MKLIASACSEQVLGLMAQATGASERLTGRDMGLRLAYEWGGRKLKRGATDILGGTGIWHDGVIKRMDDLEWQKYLRCS